MREQLIQYVELLFAGAADCEDIKQEILQNTLDRYDDLIAQGKRPEAAYRLAITGIGDLSEILGATTGGAYMAAPSVRPQPEDTQQEADRKRMHGLAIVLYILCPVPLLILGSTDITALEVLGVCGLLAMVAYATYLMVITSKKEDAPEKSSQESPLCRSVRSAISALGLVVYVVLSFATGAWFITWIIFPIVGAINGLVKAIFDLKEAMNHEEERYH